MIWMGNDYMHVAKGNLKIENPICCDQHMKPVAAYIPHNEYYDLYENNKKVATVFDYTPNRFECKICTNYILWHSFNVIIKIDNKWRGDCGILIRLRTKKDDSLTLNLLKKLLLYYPDIEIDYF